MTEIILTRDELYKMVWDEPVSRIAKRLGVSDVAIAKVCRKLNVPRPPRGYWARLQNGYPVERKPLPKLDTHTPTKYVLQPQGERPPQPSDTNDRITVPIPERVHRIHPCLVSMRNELKRQRPDEFGRIGWSESGIHVSPDTVPRAARLLTILFRFLEMRGHSATSSDRNLELRVSGETLRISLYEPAKREEIGTTSWGTKDYKHHPTGRLELKLSVPKFYRIKSQWSDRKTRSLEEALGDIVAAIEHAPTLIAAQRQEDEIRERQWARENLVRERLRNRIKLSHKRAEVVDELSRNLAKAETIRRFVEAVEHHPNSPAATSRMARWAKTYAEHLDPLCESRLPILDEKVSEFW